MPRWTEQARKIQSARMRGNTFNVGRKYTEEEKEIRRKAMLGTQHAKGHKWTEERKANHREKMKGNKLRLGIPHTDKIKKAMSEARRGNQYRLGIPHDEKFRREHSERMRGKGNPFYIDGRWSERQDERLRLSRLVDYKLWREKVFQRDDYTCQICNVRGGKLTADHIKPWRYFPELRYDVSNGQTLCVPCHRQTDSYGSKVHSYRSSQ